MPAEQQRSEEIGSVDEIGDIGEGWVGASG